MRIRPFLALSLVGAAAALACSGFGASNTAGPGDGGGVDDGGGRPDGDAAGDADAGGDANSGDSGFCAAHPVRAFCEDFDHPPLSPQLIPTPGDDGGMLSIGSPANSQPAAAQMKTEAFVGTGPRYGAAPNPPTPITHVRLSLALVPVQVDGDPSSRVGLVALGPSAIDGKPHLRIESNGSSMTLVRVAPGDGGLAATPLRTASLPSLGKYADVAIDVVYTAATAKVSFVVGGAIIGTDDVDLPTPDDVRFRFGILYAAPASGTFQFGFDDVLLVTD